MTQVKTHGNLSQIWQMQKRSSTTIKDIEIFNGCTHTTPCSCIHTNLHHPTHYHTPLPMHCHLLIWCQKVTMNSKPNSPIQRRPTTPIRLVVYNSDWEQTAEPNIWQEDITFTLVEQHSSSDKENDGGLIKVEEDIRIGNSESQVLPTDVTPPPGTAERTDPSINMSSGTVQERTQLSYLCQTSWVETWANEDNLNNSLSCCPC